MGQYYSYMNIQTKDESKIKSIIDKYDISLPVCGLCVREYELDDIIKELFDADPSLTVLSSTRNINVDPYVYVCIIRDGKCESHYIENLSDDDRDNLGYGRLISDVTEWLMRVDFLVKKDVNQGQGE